MADSKAASPPASEPVPAPEPLPARGRWFGIALMVAMSAVLIFNVAWVVRNFSLLRTMGPGKPAPAFELETLNGDKINKQKNALTANEERISKLETRIEEDKKNRELWKEKKKAASTLP